MLIRSLCAVCLLATLTGPPLAILAAEDNMIPSGSAAQVIEPCRGGTAISVTQLRKYCNYPGRCGEPMPCEGKVACVAGAVDETNIWDKVRHPWLPVGKFFLRGLDDQRMLEVRVKSQQADLVFTALRSRISTSAMAVVEGRIKGVDLPTMRHCRRDVVLLMDSPSAISSVNDGE